MPLPTQFQRVFDTERIDSLRKYRVIGSPPEAELDRIVESAARICATPMAFLTFLDDQRQWIKARFGSSMVETTLDKAVCAAAIEEDDLFVVPDCAADPRVNWCSAVYGDPPIAFYAGTPLRDPMGRPLGTLCVVDVVARPDGLAVVQSAALKSLAGAAMSILDARLEA